MHWNRKTFRISFFVASVSCLFGMPQLSNGQQVTEDSSAKKTVQPVFRVPKVASLPAAATASKSDDDTTGTKSKTSGSVANLASRNSLSLPMPDTKKQVVSDALRNAPAPHPLDRAVEMAHSGLKSMRANIRDYTAIMVKRENVNNVLGAPEYMRVKIRNERVIDNKAVPFGIYMKFIKPKRTAGREVIWVNGKNDNKIIAHEGGFLGVKRFHLDPTGWMAMKGQRHPIYEAGLEKMVIKLIEKAERDRSVGLCQVDYVEGAKINGRKCTMIKVIHPDRKHPYEFHIAKVYIDDELNIPIRYVAYDWPSVPGAQPRVLEEYTYIKVKLNVGLTDLDFNPDNPSYKYPSR